MKVYNRAYKRDSSHLILRPEMQPTPEAVTESSYFAEYKVVGTLADYISENERKEWLDR